MSLALPYAYLDASGVCPGKLVDPASWNVADFQYLDVPIDWRVLLNAYKLGMFLWSNESEPKAWWCPDPRAIMELAEFHISRSLQKTIRQGRLSTTFDQDFVGTLAGCADRDETWLFQELIDGLVELHHMKYAHSVECWLDGRLVGGVYGLDIDGIFIAESMFSTESNASKVALAALVDHLKICGFRLMDCQILSSHTASLGAKNVTRQSYLKALRRMQYRLDPMPCWRNAV